MVKRNLLSNFTFHFLWEQNSWNFSQRTKEALGPFSTSGWMKLASIRQQLILCCEISIFAIRNGVHVRLCRWFALLFHGFFPATKTIFEIRKFDKWRNSPSTPSHPNDNVLNHVDHKKSKFFVHFAARRNSELEISDHWVPTCIYVCPFEEEQDKSLVWKQQERRLGIQRRND